MINHPEVEIYYENEKGEESLSEDYEVYVDEDCSTCHESFLPQLHFSPLIPAHDLTSNWNDLPWWLDTKYLMFFNDRDDSSTSTSSGYQHVSTQRRNDLPPAQQGGYAPISGRGSSTSNTAAASTVTPSNDGLNSNTRSRSTVDKQNSGSSSRLNATTSKRKFRKRK